MDLPIGPPDVDGASLGAPSIEPSLRATSPPLEAPLPTPKELAAQLFEDSQELDLGERGPLYVAAEAVRRVQALRDGDEREGYLQELAAEVGLEGDVFELVELIRGTALEDDLDLLAQAGPGPRNYGYSRERRADFTLIGRDRQATLEDFSEQLIDHFADGKTHAVRSDGRGNVIESIPRLTYEDMADLLVHLKFRSDLTDVEKAFVWSQIADGKGRSDARGFHDATVRFDVSEGLNPAMRDETLPFGAFAYQTPVHTFVSFRDSVHGFGNARTTTFEQHDGTRDRSWGLDTLDNVREESLARETNRLGHTNWGDYHASLAAAAAMQAFRDAQTGHRFEAFANALLHGTTRDGVTTQSIFTEDAVESAVRRYAPSR